MYFRIYIQNPPLHLDLYIFIPKQVTIKNNTQLLQEVEAKMGKRFQWVGGRWITKEAAWPL